MHSTRSVYLDSRPKTRHSKATGLFIDAPRVKWQWHYPEPTVDVFKTIRVDPYMSVHREEMLQWSIRYPEEAPAGARYELIIDEPPTLTPEQIEEVRVEKAALVELWHKEKAIQDTLLSLWSPKGLVIDTRDAWARSGLDRFIEYRSSIYIGPFNIEALVKVQYNDQSCYCYLDMYQVLVELGLSSGSNIIHLTTIKLPIVDGVASNAPLIEYLRDSPLMKASQALSKLGRAIKKGEDK
ncbi:hypothetical protein [Microcoleus phage My-WqHQDG]|nr:hypothetical protein [Microcoleus phage My-WqHQDG]